MSIVHAHLCFDACLCMMSMEISRINGSQQGLGTSTDLVSSAPRSRWHAELREPFKVAYHLELLVSSAKADRLELLPADVASIC